MKRLCKISTDTFLKLVVCPSCHIVYKIEDCIEFDTAGRKSSPKVLFPNHPYSSRRKPCNENLLAEVSLCNGEKQYYPRKVYCYASVVESLKSILERDGILQSCEHWRGRSVIDGIMGDVYDGRVWQEFVDYNGSLFFSSPNNLGLMLNIDWFNPFKHSPYSVGAIYLVLLNLPRSQRFKLENMILVGIIPGPTEPSLHLNSYLDPLVDELNFLFDVGIEVSGSSHNNVIVKAALLLVACDIPAARKVCGFLGHAGCSKCLKEFVSGGFGEHVSYGGFDECPLRTETIHRQHAQEALNKTTSTSRDKTERELGSRYTSLMRLPYFNCVRFHIIDPMHNLFLGTAKHMMKNIWLKNNDGTGTLLSNSDLIKIQERVDSCIVPGLMGRIPRKIAANFSSFKADEWKSWVTTFSIYTLHGLLEGQHLDCWRKFVRACRLLSTVFINNEKILQAHSLLIQFGKDVERLYGPDAVTINMHLHTHLKDCILDFGPISSFWVFGFERFNGYLGKFPTNNRSCEIQIMRKFLRDVHFRTLQLSSDSTFIDLENFTEHLTGTLKEMSVSYNVFIELLPLQPIEEIHKSYWSFTEHY